MPTPRKYVVKGTVKDKIGNPVPNVKVQAFRRELHKKEASLGKAHTDNQGAYSIEYEVTETPINLALKVFTKQGELLQQTKVYFDVAKDETIDIKLKNIVEGFSGFEKTKKRLEPLLGEELKFADLEQDKEHDDIRFLAGKTGLSATEIARLSLAHRLNDDSKIDPEFWQAILALNFYDSSENLSLEEQYQNVRLALPSLDAKTVRKAIRIAIRKNVIPATDGKKIEEWTTKFSEYAAQQNIEAGTAKKKTFISQVLKDAGLTKDKQIKFSKLFQQHRVFSDKLLQDLKADPAFKDAEIADIQTSFRLAELTNSDFSIVKMIKKEFDIHTPEAIRNLAKKGEQEWVKAVDKNLKSGDLEIPFQVKLPEGVKFNNAELFGRQLARQFEQAFPTAAFSGGLERARNSGQKPALKKAAKIEKFLGANQDFEFLRTPIDTFLEAENRPDLDTYRKDDDFRQELKAVQRLFKLAPNYDATNSLLSNNLHSAQQIYRMGESEFVRVYKNQPGFDEESARRTWHKAAETNTAVMMLVSELKATENAGAVAALRSGNEAVKDFPNWNNLFRSGDICECEHCQSVLAPAAYFADLLMFLKDRNAKPGDSSVKVKDVLFERRPDLGYLELNCANALTHIPYIDVVCEVLEDVVAAGENDLELVGLTAIDADIAQAKTDVQNAFQAKGITLGSEFDLSRVGNTNKWVLHHDDITYLLKKKATANYFAEILRNTKASAEELRAYPQYVNPKAYDKLKTAKYPFSLPFDLFNAEVRAGFKKAGLKRWELMETFRGAAAPNNPTEGDIAAEFFGISVDKNAPIDEKRIITEAHHANQHEFWGEPDNATMNANLSNVKTFLQKTDLECNELYQLLDLQFVNPAGTLDVKHLDATCDLDQKRIGCLSEQLLDGINRFLRMWRKLDGWKMWELDMVIRHPAIGNGKLDEAFLINLMYFIRVKEELGSKISIEQLCSLFGDINTETHFTKLHEKRANGLYQDLFLNRKLIHPIDQAFDVSKVDVANSVETITDHQSVVLAALRTRESDLVIYKNLKKASDGANYITDELTLKNLSFLYRHSWLAKHLKIKAKEWQTLLKLLNQDLPQFTTPRVAYEFLKKVKALDESNFKIDELNYILSADLTAKAAPREQIVIRFLSTLRSELQRIAEEYEADPPTEEEPLLALLTSLLQKLNRDEQSVKNILDTIQNTVLVSAPVQGMPAGFEFPAAIKENIRISYDDANGMLRFSGLMQAAEQNTLKTDAALAAVTGLPAYQDAIDELYWSPRLAMKFYVFDFKASLNELPAEIDFKQQLTSELSAKISYDQEQRILHFNSIMTKKEKTALDNLSVNADYRNAIDSLFTQPKDGAFTTDEIWIQDGDLIFPLEDNIVQNLTTACQKAMAYLKQTLTNSTLIEQLSSQFDLTTAIIKELITKPTDAILQHFLTEFAVSSGPIEYLPLRNKKTIDIYHWLNRVSLLLNKWKFELEDLQWLMTYHAPTQTLSIESLPIDSARPVSSLDHFIRTIKLFHFRERVDESEISFLEVFEKLDMDRLNPGEYPNTDFAKDVYLLKEWDADDVEKLTNCLNLAYSADYMLVENWERLSKAFDFLDKLNAGTDTVKSFANPAVGQDEAKTLKELLRSKFGVDTWLTLSTEIQDVLRDRKREALLAWMLTYSQPNSPSKKWENANDVYAYYLLDVEMTSCMLTSRMVQASGSVQLFVQRCMMGLEPDVVVKADGDDGDSAWKWWKWMRKYRVWEANRKIFLYPENWIEPELRRDKSPFFKDLENELLQNEVNETTVEAAFLNYLEKLDDVALLEIAGFYHEDDGDQTIVHVFGRTKGAEPHVYYYRQFDYRRWTPWEKVDLDITGDYLIPVVVNKRLFLFWPVFTEVPDKEGNKTVAIPEAGDKNAPVPEAQKKLKIQLAVSEFRNGKWTPKKVSKESDISKSSYVGEIVKDNYRFWPVDRSEINGRFGIKYNSDASGNNLAKLDGAFEIFGCKGVPKKATFFPGKFQHGFVPEDSRSIFMKYVENDSHFDRTNVAVSGDDLTLDASYMGLILHNELLNYLPEILSMTPGTFKIAMPWHASFMDKFLMNIPKVLPNAFSQSIAAAFEEGIPIGTWMPFFYADQHRTFYALPKLILGEYQSYYPDIKKWFKETRDTYVGYIRQFIQNFDPDTLPAAQRQQLENLLGANFDRTPPFSNEEILDMLYRFLLQIVNLALGYLNLILANLPSNFRKFHFNNNYHPFVCDFAKLVYNPLKGIPALMSRETQLKNTGFSFQDIYQPTEFVVADDLTDPDKPIYYYPREIVDFSPAGSYSPYNWEIFFHAPLMIANRLSQEQRFEEAMQWYHFIFNPIGVEGTLPDGTNAGAPQKYWITKPFFLTTDEKYKRQRIDSILRMLAGDVTAPGFTEDIKDELEKQVKDWRDNPFEPHRIAQYRTVAYQKTTVMKYLDNLIAWGDYLFRQDSMESVNEATQIYIMAAEILGPKPKKIAPIAKPKVETYNELEDEFDKFSNALIQVENMITVMPGDGFDGGDLAPLPLLYFCIPQNDKLLEYWDTVADRLYKIRHCMNIEGVERQLSLFEPPIEPGALVNAAAAGIDISSVLADLNAPLPYYRFNVVLQKANEFCNDVKGLGSALLSALEKKDAEEMSLLRQSQEIKLLEAMKTVREKQIDEAKENLEALKKSKKMVEIRRNYYRDIERLNSHEKLHLDKLNEAHTLQEVAQGIKLGASIISILPAIDLGASGFGGSPHATVKIGGLELGQAASLSADVLSFLSMIASNDSAMASSKATFDRRWDDWKLQERIAEKELEQIDKQIAAAELRIAIAEKELENQKLQIENAKATDEFMKSKYTNKELYQWMVGEISRVYFQSYQLAYDMAKRAERCFRFELGIQDSNYIQFGYWDSLKKGLLSGDKLQYDLRRLENAYLEQNRRELELTKHISLAMLNPLALMQLKETGRCFFTLPEEIFDLDYPGHYFRRIKSVSITLPCVVGPYTTISCTLRLLKNYIRIKTTPADPYEHNNDEGVWTDDERFVENNIPVKVVATSNAQNDSGVFELNFRDERYLPFEGAGVISEWALELFHDLPSNNPDPANPDFGKPLRQFDYSTISDAIIHINYYAREDAGVFKNSAITHLREYFAMDDATPGFRMFSLRHDFPNEWHRFLNPVNEDDGNVLEFELNKEHFPFKDSGHNLKVNMLVLLVKCTEERDYDVVFTQPLLEPPPADIDIKLEQSEGSETYGNLHFAEKDTSGDSVELDFNVTNKWKFEITSPTGNNLQQNEMEELILIVGYEWE